MPTVTIGGTAFNTVTVTGTIYDVGSGGFSTGTLQFSMTDVLYDVAAKACGITGAVGATLNAQGAFSVALFAHDNSGTSTDWYWQLTGTVDGIAIPARKFKLYHALGDSQDITQILAASAVIA